MSTIAGRKLLGGATWAAMQYVPKRRGRGYVRIFVPTAHDTAGGVVCRVCAAMFLSLTSHLHFIHGLTVAAYRRLHGADAPVLTDELRGRLLAGGRAAARRLHENVNHRTCARCGRPFERWGRRIGRYGGWLCSAKCTAEARATRRGLPPSCTKLTEPEVKAIRERLMAGAKQAQIARTFGVSPSTINLIAKRKTWISA